jgi:C-5 cytosine-specific DNA methylase
MRIGTLDLFSGIGGISLALAPVCETVCYCEIDATCVRVLEDNMARGLLKHAPVEPDVTTLAPAAVRALGVVRMITAGFPCQDISRANIRGEGVTGSRSRLVFEVFRLLDGLDTVQCVLLENSSNIMTRGVEKVVREFAVRGWSAAHGVFDAREVGAVHARKRWVLVACAPGFAPPGFPCARRRATREPARVVPDDESANGRCSVLGNSVVPAFIAYAYNRLLPVLRGEAAPRADVGARARVWTTDPDDGRAASAWRPVPAFRAAPNLHLEQGRTHLEYGWWATPTRTHWIRCAKLTRDVANMHLSVRVIYERATREYMRRSLGTTSIRDVAVNPEFVEWLMMFPRGWTRAAAAAPVRLRRRRFLPAP